MLIKVYIYYYIYNIKIVEFFIFHNQIEPFLFKNCSFESINSSLLSTQFPIYFKNIYLTNVLSLNKYLIEVENSYACIQHLYTSNCSSGIISLKKTKIILKNSIFSKTQKVSLSNEFIVESCLLFQSEAIETESFLDNITFFELFSNLNGSVLYKIFH